MEGKEMSKSNVFSFWYGWMKTYHTGSSNTRSKTKSDRGVF